MSDAPATRALHNVAAKWLSLAAEKGAQLVLLLVAAPLLGVVAFGRYSFAAGVGALLAFGTDLGITLWTTRALARAPAQTLVVLGTGLRLRLLAAIPVLLALAGVALVVGAGEGGPEFGWAVVIVGVMWLLRTLLDHARAVFRARERLGDEGKVNVLMALAATAAGLAALAAVSTPGRGLVALSLGMLAGTIIGSGYGFWLLGRDYGPWAGPGDRPLARRILRESLPFWLAGVFTLVYARADVVVLRLFSSDAEVGAYRAAGQLVEVAKQLPLAVLTALFPRLARAFADAPGQLARLERRLGWALAASGAAAGALMALAAGPVVRLAFGPEFARAIPTLRVLAVAMPLLFLNAGLLHFFVARDRGHVNLVLSGAMVLVNLAANLVLAARYGAVGSALATLVTEGALTLGCLYALRLVRRDRPQ